MADEAQKLQPWETIEKSVAFETPWFKIQKQHMKTATGVELDYYIHDSNDSVICVCVNEHNQVLIEWQYRPPVEKVSIDYPAGRAESDDKNTEAAIRRELQEEAGFTATSLQKLAVIDKEPGFSKSRMHVFLAHGNTVSATHPDETESIVTKFVAPDKILEMISKGEMTCTFCVSATFLAFQKLGWLQATAVQAPAT